MSSNSSSSGTNQSASGVDGQSSDNLNAGQENQTAQSVSYESHQKLLAEKKKFQQAAKDLEAKLREIEEKDLKAKGELEQLLKLREDDLLKERNARQETERVIQRGLKLDAFLKAVNGKIDQNYYPLIDFDSILTDPETGMPDVMSVQKIAKEFETKYSKVIERGTGVKMPNDAPQGGGSESMSVEAFRSLKTAKEMKAALAKAVASYKAQ